MRRSNWIVRCLFVLSVATAGVSLPGCSDENDPKTWVPKLANDASRPAATRRLKMLFESTMATVNNDARSPAVRHFLDVALEPLVTSFTAHADDMFSRREAIEVIAQAEDPRALPALIDALRFTPGNVDSSRIALRSATALKNIAARPDGVPAAQRTTVINGIIAAIGRATGNSGDPVQIRYNCIQALGGLHATEAVDTLVRLLSRPLGEQDISTARAAAEALGNLGDPRGVDALIYGLFLNIRAQNAFPHCERALAQIGAAAVVPRLVVTLNGQNTQVQALITAYANIPNAPPPPPGYIQSTAADVLRVFADASSTDALLTVMNDHEQSDNVRGAAGEALSYIAVAVPAQRTRILAAITTVFNENQPDHLPEGHGWTATMMAPRLALIGDPASAALIARALQTPAIAAADHAPARLDLLLPFASIARHGDVALFERIERPLRSQLEAMISSAPAEDRADVERQVRPLLQNLDRLARVISVARDCADGEMACYVGKLGDAQAEVVRKAAYMLAWTTPPAQQEAARTAILARINHSDILVRRSLMVAIDMLSPQGCPACVTRIEDLIRTEHGQESKILSHLDGQLLMGRLRARTGH